MNFLWDPRRSRKRNKISLIVVSVGKSTFAAISNSVLMLSFFICHGRVDLRFPSFVSSGARDLIAKLLKYRVEERLSLKKILEHPWVLQHLSPEIRAR